MFINTDIEKTNIANSTYITIYFQAKAKKYLRNLFTTKNKEIQKWDEYLLKVTNKNLLDNCFEVINNSKIVFVGNKSFIYVDPKYEDIYKLMKFGNLEIAKTAILENAFMYAAGRL